MPAGAFPPDLLPGAVDFYRAFLECGSDRTIGMSIGPIPFSSIDRYAARHGYTGDEFDLLSRVVRAADDEFLRIVNKPRK